jgi:bacteriocin-like protein
MVEKRRGPSGLTTLEETIMKNETQTQKKPLKTLTLKDLKQVVGGDGDEGGTSKPGGTIRQSAE